MQKRIYVTKEELRELEIRMSNDYVGVIDSARYMDYLDNYEVILGFESRKEREQFCRMYGYKICRVGKDRSLLIKDKTE